MASKPWSGRFSEPTDKEVEEFTESISLDHRLYKQDIEASIAHAQMLEHVGLLTVAECTQIVQGLTDIRAEISAGTFPFSIELEDIHMHVESALIGRIGDVGRKLHTARSRNDQVATDLKLWTRESLDVVSTRVLNLQRAFLEFGERHREVLLPGYTHLQRAQPILAPHYALAYVEKLQRDRDRIADCRRRLNSLPLGTAALAGTSLPIDRRFVARKLAFDSVVANSLDASSDRDFALEAAFVLSLIAQHLSGWAEEWVIWSSQEFSFLILSDSVCTGSSIMPQKKNPDVCELIRARSARVAGNLTTLLMLVKGLPLAYNRDLQEDKRPLFDSFDTVSGNLHLAALVIRGAALRSERISASLEDGFLDATTLMESLITRGVPQRTAHEVVGRLVGLCEKRGCRLADLQLADFQAAHPSLGPDVYSALGAAHVISAFKSQGSTAPQQVQEQLELWRSRLDQELPENSP